MIIATKTSIKVMYAAKSSKSNLSSSGLGAVEFIGIPESQILHPWMWSPDFLFQNRSVLLECLPDGFMSRNIPKESQNINKVSTSYLSPYRFRSSRYWTVSTHCAKVLVKLVTFKGIAKDMNFSISAKFVLAQDSDVTINSVNLVLFTTVPWNKLPSI